MINLSNIDNFFSVIFGGTIGIEPGAAGWEATMLPLCNVAPFNLITFGRNPTTRKSKKWHKCGKRWEGIKSFNQPKKYLSDVFISRTEMDFFFIWQQFWSIFGSKIIFFSVQIFFSVARFRKKIHLRFQFFVSLALVIELPGKRYLR